MSAMGGKRSFRRYVTQVMVRGAVITATLLLTGCGQYLGSYTIEAAKVVTRFRN